MIELGRKLTPFPDEHRTDANKVQGCVSQVWLATDDSSTGTGGRSSPLPRQRRSHRPRPGRDLIALLSGRPAAEISGENPLALFRAARSRRAPDTAAFERLRSMVCRGWRADANRRVLAEAG